MGLLTHGLPVSRGSQIVQERAGRSGARRTCGPKLVPGSDAKRHVLQKIAGHGSLKTTQRYLHPDDEAIAVAGGLLSSHLSERSRPKLKSV